MELDLIPSYHRMPKPPGFLTYLIQLVLSSLEIHRFPSHMVSNPNIRNHFLGWQSSSNHKRIPIHVKGKANTTEKMLGSN